MRTNTMLTIVVLLSVMPVVLPPALGQDAAPEALQAAQSVAVLSPVADAAIDSTESDGNQGSSSTLNVFWSGQSEEGHALLRFNLAVAAPFVAGAASPAWGVNPNLTHKQVKGLIHSTRH